MPGAQMQGRRGNVDGNGAIALRRKESHGQCARRLLLLAVGVAQTRWIWTASEGAPRVMLVAGRFTGPEGAGDPAT